MIAFKNEELTNFADPIYKTKMQEAIAKVQSELGQDYPLIINGKKVYSENRITSINPGNVDQIIGTVRKADRELAEKALSSSLNAFENWKIVSPEARAGYLFKAAALMRRKKFELSAWLCVEVGKNWAEADADVAEAIDFLEFYGREAIRLSANQPLPELFGEDNRLTYIPLGVGVIIPPWNFPFAILAGMTTAAIVTGNCVLLKPASSAPVIAYKFMEIMEQVGIPAGVINFVPGSGSEIGDFLVTHPKTRFISFTGSKDVGLRINELAAKPQHGQIWIKRIVAEMGGKDAIVVDADANLEEVANGIVASAFGFQGQKCSACSRAIVHKDVYDQVLERVIERVKKISVGPAEENVAAGPVVDKAAYKKILEYIEIGKDEGQLEIGGGTSEGNGYYIQPTVFSGVDPQARIAQEEIFGPVLAFIKADSFDHALKIFNDTEFGLTGSLYSNTREHLERARVEMHCGNLYFNRKCTGALVGVHPFGGFNLSGTDSKAGGRDYLLLFSQAKSVSEKL